MNCRSHCLHAAVATALLSSVLGACRSPNAAVNQILTPAYVEFEDLFAPQDTIRLETAVLIGRSWMIDVNSKGELLVHDNQGQGVHLFSPSGAYLRTLSITDCNPEATFGFRSQSRYLDDSHILVLTTKGAMVFDDAGQCVQTSMDSDFVTSAYSVCTRRDTVFVMPQASTDSAFIRAYSPDFSLIDQFPLPAPQFPRRASVMHPYQGRTLGCFTDDVWWIYGEGFDAVPRLHRNGLTRFRPSFYRERTRDYPETPFVDQSNWQEVTQILDEAEEDGSAIDGMYELDQSTRMLLYGAVDSANEERPAGILVVNHENRFAAVSTLVPESVETAKHGMLYLEGDLAEPSNDDVANPTLVRYRFIPPNN